MNGRKEEISWGKLNPLLAWKTFSGLQSEGNLSLEDCQQCKLTLENTRLNILDGIADLHDYDIEWIEDKMSIIEVAIIGLENDIEIVHQYLDYNLDKLVTKRDSLPCQRCTMKSILCRFNLCPECCREPDCNIHFSSNEDPMKDHILNNIEPVPEEKINKLPREEESLQAFFDRKNKKRNKNKKQNKNDEKEAWADALFGIEDDQNILACPECGNADLYNDGQFKNYCYVCKQNVQV